MDQTMDSQPTAGMPAPVAHSKVGIRTLGMVLIPLLLLAVVIAVFVSTGAGLHVEPAAPVEKVTVERIVLHPGVIEFHLRNVGPNAWQIAQVKINDATWPFEVTPGPTMPRLGTQTVTIPYPWVRGEAYDISLFSSNSIAVPVSIPVAAETPDVGGRTLLSFTLIGVYVGVIPVFLGLFWFPALKQLGKHWMNFLLAVTAGILIFLGVETLSDGLEVTNDVAGPFQGIGLVAIGLVVTFLALDAIGRRQRATGRGDAERRLTLAYRIATGIGVHNLGEGLAIGAAYGLGQLTLGGFLVIGFIIQNITEGLGIIAPVLRDRPTVRNLALMGLIGGGPAVLGAWIGGLSYSAPLAALFLGIGSGAIFEVVYEIGKMIAGDTDRERSPVVAFAGVTLGLLLLWGLGVLIK